MFAVISQLVAVNLGVMYHKNNNSSAVQWLWIFIFFKYFLILLAIVPLDINYASMSRPRNLLIQTKLAVYCHRSPLNF